MSLARKWLFIRDDDSSVKPGVDCSEWCVCGICRMEEREIERVCCGKTNCRSQEDDFNRLVLSREVIALALRNKADIIADPENRSNNALRKTAYRQYIS